MASKGKIQTVRKCITPEQLGVTLTHEHLAIDYRKAFFEPWPGNEQNINLDFQMKNLGWIRQFPYSAKENLEVYDQKSLDSIVQEMKKYKSLGGGSIVDCSNHGLGRDMDHLVRIEKETGVNVIAGTGYYFDKFQPQSVLTKSVEEMTGVITSDILSGWKGTNVKCGVIGEVGCSYPLTMWEKRTLQAAAIAQTELGAPVIIHPGRDSQAPEEINRVLLEAGGDLSRTVMSHVDRTFQHFDELLEYAKLGTIVEFDLFGIETSLYQANEYFDMPSDAERIRMIAKLIENGFEDNIVIAQDIHTKHRLEMYGGHGFTHIQRVIIPMMKIRGITQHQIEKMTIHTPKRWLQFK